VSLGVSRGEERTETDLFQEVEGQIREVIRLGNTSEAEWIFRFDVGLEAEPGLEEFEEVKQAEIILLIRCALQIESWFSCSFEDSKDSSDR